MSVALGRLAEEDPTLQVQTNEETGQTEISGMGELHLEVLVDRMLREYKVDANVGRPQVSYRETIRGTAEKIEGRFVRQTGGSGQYGIGYIHAEPAAGDAIGDLNRRRGHVSGMEQRGNAQVITAYVPLAQMFGYATDVRSNTQGRATYTMQFERYEEVPPNIAEAIGGDRAAAA